MPAILTRRKQEQEVKEEEEEEEEKERSDPDHIPDLTNILYKYMSVGLTQVINDTKKAKRNRAEPHRAAQKKPKNLLPISIGKRETSG